MKVLTPAEMRDLDRRAIELGIPGIVLMENAGARVVEFLAGRFSPLSAQRIVIVCGKGNNGGDGLVIARQLLTRFHPARLDVLLASDPAEFQGDAAANYRMFELCGGKVSREIAPIARAATLVIDALLGTGVKGPVTGSYAEWVHEINTGFPLAKIVAVDVPSGEVRAHHTITFVAPKIEQVLGPGYELNGELIIASIGTPARLTDGIQLHLSGPEDFAPLFRPRPRDSNKGDYGHVLVVGGAAGKTGAVTMTGLAALRAGAGLVSVASEAASLPPELMGEPLDGFTLERKTVLAVGPGLGSLAHHQHLARALFAESQQPLVADADALNALAGTDFKGGDAPRVLTPHPGEIGRLCGLSVSDVQSDRLGIARRFAAERNVIVVLKGDRTVIAHPDGKAWINPTGSPAMSTGGTGDILTGLIAGLIAQFPGEVLLAVRAAVWLHGRAGEIGAGRLGEKGLIATDLLSDLPEAMRECQNA